MSMIKGTLKHITSLIQRSIAAKTVLENWWILIKMVFYSSYV